MKKQNYKLIIKDKRMKKKLLIAVMIVSLVLLMGAYKGGIGEVIGFYGTVSNVEGAFIVSNSAAIADDNSYSTLLELRLMKAWDTNAGALGDNATVTRANAAISDTDLRATTADGWLVNVPSTTPDGWYLWTRYNNATPDDADAIRDRRIVNIISGSIQTSDDR